jgi:diguanylate cyclase (GGDEF)-like protein
MLLLWEKINTQGVILQLSSARIGLLISLLMLSLSSVQAHFQEVGQHHGAFDFSNWQSGSGVTRLDGTWSFYWQQQLEPQQGQGEASAQIQLPATWDKLGASDQLYPGQGFATLSTQLINLPQDVRWSVIIPEQSTAFRLFVDDELVAEGGIAGVSKASSKAYSGNQFVELGLLPEKVKLTWHVSNFHHHSGGPWQSLVLGPYAELGKHYFLNTFDQAIVVSLALIAGLFLLIQFLIDRRDKASGLLSVFAFIIALRIGITDYQPIYLVLGQLHWQIHVRLMYFSMLIAPPVILFWQHYIFPVEMSKTIARYCTYAFLLALVSVIVLPSTWFTAGLSLYLLMILVAIAIYGWSLARVVLHKRQGAWTIVLGALALLVTIIHDMAVYSQWINNERLWITYGLLAFMFSLGVNILFLRAKQKRQVISLSEQLMTANKQLEARVAQRTVELAEKADALEEANDKLQVLANIDGLTGVLNRRAFVEQLEMLARVKPNVALLMIDIDHFKRINDNYGHIVGDQVLKRLSAVLLEIKRETDRVGRFGGEEFMILLQDISDKGLDSYCRRLLKEIREIDFSDLAPLKSISISLGTSSATLTSHNIDSLIHQADEAMYYVKNHGRNNFKHFATL